MSLLPEFTASQAAAAIAACSAALSYAIYSKRQTGFGSTLPGPPNKGFLMGNLPQFLDPNVHGSQVIEEWVEKYGTTFSVHGFLSVPRLYTVDPKTINAILTRASDFPKPQPTREVILKTTGEGLLYTEGEVHKRQRKILNPVFGPNQIRQLTPLFLQKAAQLRDAFTACVLKDESTSATIDVLSWFSLATLDVIGEAGFGYQFGAVDGESNELSQAFAELFKSVSHFDLLAVLRLYLPFIDAIPSDRKRSADASNQAIRKIGMSLIDEKKRYLEELAGGTEVEKDHVRGRDLLSVLIKSNVANDLPESQKMSTDEILAQIATFILAGHETTSTGLTWFFYAMVTHPEVQQKLREELRAFPHDNPSMDELNSFTYLDWVLREVMRLHSPVTSTSRSPTKDEVLPVSEPYTDKWGQVHNEVRMKAGDIVFIPITAVNTLKRLWGPDAKEFKPERWASLPEETNSIPSVYANTLSFLNGPRGCIGWRMAIVEEKAFIFTLLRSFSFSIDPSLVIEKRSGIAVTRPVVQSQLDKGNQLPLRVSFAPTMNQ